MLNNVLIYSRPLVNMYRMNILNAFFTFGRAPSLHLFILHIGLFKTLFVLSIRVSLRNDVIYYGLY